MNISYMGEYQPRRNWRDIAQEMTTADPVKFSQLAAELARALESVEDAPPNLSPEPERA